VNADHIRSLLDSYVHGGPFPGIMVGMFDTKGKELMVHSARKSDRDMMYNRNTLFRVHSLTKPITAIAALILMERGKLSLDDEISQYLPMFQNMEVFVEGDVNNYSTQRAAAPITVRHLLTHTSGISYSVGIKAVDKIMRVKLGNVAHISEFNNRPPSDFADAVAKSPLLFQPGSAFEYGANFEILGQVLEIAAGMKFEDFVQREIFDPLGMADSTFNVPPERHGTIAPSTEFQLGHRVRPAKLPLFHLTACDPIYYAGYGLYTSLADYSKLVSLLMGEGELHGVRLISRENTIAMVSNQLPNGADISELTDIKGVLEADSGGFGHGYGLSVMINPSVALGGGLSSSREFGWSGISSCFFYADPVHDHSLILLSASLPINTYPIRAQLRYLGHRMVADMKNR
jgi:CubicO group peptidase (beta-lactamase class C family)